MLPEGFKRRASGGLWVEVEYYGSQYGEFRLQYASTDRAATEEGLYKAAAQRWLPDAVGLHRFRRRACSCLPDFDPSRSQNLGASFRFEFRRELLLTKVAVSLAPPPDLESIPATAPVPELKSCPAASTRSTTCSSRSRTRATSSAPGAPTRSWTAARLHEEERVFGCVDEIAQKRSFLGPIFPVKLHQMGEPMLHPELPAIVAYAEERGVPIELNTNCGLDHRRARRGALPRGPTPT